MMVDYLAKPWNWVEQDLIMKLIPYTTQVTKPHEQVETWGDYRVVRIREGKNGWEFVLARDKFGPRGTKDPL